MKKITITLFAMLLLLIGANYTAAQKAAPDYKITNIKILPFDSQKGDFQDAFKMNDERSFFNDLAISLLVLVEISGEAGSFQAGRKVDVTVTEGKKAKAKVLEQIGLIGEGGKYYQAVWLKNPMCDEIKITAKILGQRTASSMTRKVPFMCGE